MPMPKNLVPKRQVKVYIPEDLHAQVQLILYDPVTDRIKKGALSDLFESLLREWLRKQKEKTSGR